MDTASTCIGSSQATHRHENATILAIDDVGAIKSFVIKKSLVYILDGVKMRKENKCPKHISTQGKV
ncbi:MAG: hypothetical protein AUK35_03430 [Zetaproteobacteria bacterium CG2_30_46_52]|nr:MAG: hypothetical protein AUK35_03430 [Zetaproteobacteria bacterium CG2_30_46_52]